MSIKVYTLIFCLLTSLVGLAQKKHHNKTFPRHERVLKPGNHTPNSFVIKLNTEGAESFNPLTSHSSLFNNLPVRILNIERLFPQEKNTSDPYSVSISRIYQITYQGSLEVEQVLELIEGSTYLEYAEPYFISETMFVPNEPAIGNNNLFYLARYQAYEAWDITQGDSNTVIGIIDTGVRSSLPDLKNNVKYNVAEATGLPGVDDDGDGYIDNITGWDLGNNDNNPDATGNGHGTVVAGIAAATPNNGIGTVGTGFNCKFMPIKAAIDANGGSISYGYQGLYYAATHGCHVANLSWGGAGSYSQAAQDMINFAVLSKNMIVVAAAGNSGKEETYYPASYDNVLSVAASDTFYSASAQKVIDVKANLATYSYNVDLCAQGRAVYGTENNGTYSKTPGSSNAAPQVSGAAALLRTKFPELTGQQIMEQLRITGDIIDTFPENSAYKEKIGRRLNMLKALTNTTTPSVRNIAFSFKSKRGKTIFSGDTVELTLDFINYLSPTTNCKITLSSSASYIEFLDYTSNLGSISTLGSANNNSDPITFVIKETGQFNQQTPFRIQFDDVNYYDYQHFSYIINPSWVTLDNGETALTATGNGRIGYLDNNTTYGDGFIFQENFMLFEAGLMLATDKNKVSDCVRGDMGIMEQDFKNTESVRYTNSKVADLSSKSTFNDSASGSPIGINIVQNNYTNYNAPDNRFQIIEYIIENTTNATIDTLFAGIFADWDIMDSQKNRAAWNDSEKLGYVYSTEQNGLYGGIRLLTDEAPSYFAMDHDSKLGGDNIFPNDSFTAEEKYNTLRNGIARPNAGASGSGNDVSHVVGAKIVDLKPNEKRKVAFAFIGSPTLSDLVSDAENALEKYKSFNTGPIPDLANLNFCKGESVSFTLKPENGTNFNFYNQYPGTPIFSGTELAFTNQTESDTIFITNTDSLFESEVKAVYITFREKPVVEFSASPESLNLSQGSQVYFTSIGNSDNNHIWDFGDGATSTDISHVHSYLSVGEYPVTLSVTSEYGCQNTKEISYSVYNDLTTGTDNSLSNNLVKIFPIPTEQTLNLKFTNQINYSISIVNSLGIEIYSYKGQNSDSQIDTQNWQAGAYHLIIHTGNETITKTIFKK